MGVAEAKVVNASWPCLIALQPDALAIVFDFVKPLRAGGNHWFPGWNAKIQTFKHAPWTGDGSEIARL
jgi:hypothetical protein